MGHDSDPPPPAGRLTVAQRRYLAAVDRWIRSSTIGDRDRMVACFEVMWEQRPGLPDNITGRRRNHANKGVQHGAGRRALSKAA